LVVAGALLLGIGMGWIALISKPGIGYATTAAAMTVGGIGFSLALPAVTKSVVSRVAPPDIGRASGAFSTLRQFGGAFGVALTGAVFATAGGYSTARLFSDGYTDAMVVSALLALAAAAAGIALPRHRRPRPATKGRPAKEGGPATAGGPATEGARATGGGPAASAESRAR
jgi:hypothetical protein